MTRKRKNMATTHGQPGVRLEPFKGKLPDLPAKALIRLLKNVPAKETLALEKTCKRFQKLIANNTDVTQKFFKQITIYTGSMTIYVNSDDKDPIFASSVSFKLEHFNGFSIHREMDGHLDVISSCRNTDMEYRQTTRVLPTRVLLDYFIRKILNKVTLKTLGFKGANDIEIAYLKETIHPFAKADFVKVAFSYSDKDGKDKPKPGEKTVNDFISAFPSLKSIL